mgnify:CR=1 FL=1
MNEKCFCVCYFFILETFHIPYFNVIDHFFYYFKKLHHQHSEFTSENKEFTIKEKKKSFVDKQNREEIMKNHLTQLLGRKMGKKSFKFALHFLPSTPTTNSFLFLQTKLLRKKSIIYNKH